MPRLEMPYMVRQEQSQGHISTDRQLAATRWQSTVNAEVHMRVVAFMATELHRALTNKSAQLRDERPSVCDLTLGSGVPADYEQLVRIEQYCTTATGMIRLAAYLDAAHGSGDISLGVRKSGWEVLSTLWKSTDCVLPVPGACPTSDGHLILTWNKHEHHFEVEIVEDAPVELFYRNRVTGEIWDVNLEDCPQADLKKKLSLFYA